MLGYVSVALAPYSEPSASSWTPGDLARSLFGPSPQSSLDGFCIYGHLSASVLMCLNVDAHPRSADVASCLRGWTSGPFTSEEWGPLEFSSSSLWPVKVLEVRLLWEHWHRCSLTSLPSALCEDVSPRALRLQLGLIQEEEEMLPARVRAHAFHITNIWQARNTEMDIDAGHDRQGPIKFVVIGSHLGSNMEPMTLLTVCLSQLAVSTEATVYGTVYPMDPGFICELFGQCSSNAEITEVVGLLVKQMYAPAWEPHALSAKLHSALASDAAFREASLLVCAQPMPICSLLRPLTDLPMIIYQAFPLIGATPVTHRHMLLAHFQEMLGQPQRTVFIAYSEFLAEQFRYQLGQRPLCIRPHSLYATQGASLHYQPDLEHPRVLVSRMAGWARAGARVLINLVEALADRHLRPGTRLRLVFLGVERRETDTVAGLSQPFSYNGLQRYRAAVYFPWDFGMLLFSELYSLGVPLAIPSRAWMGTLIKSLLEFSDFGWWQARDSGAISLPGPGAEVGTWPWLNANSTVEQVLELYDRSDFVLWPHVQFFQGLPELVLGLLRNDFDAISAGMQAWNLATLQHSLSIGTRAVAAMLLGTQPPQSGESSCMPFRERTASLTSEPHCHPDNVKEGTSQKSSFNPWGPDHCASDKQNDSASGSKTMQLHKHALFQRPRRTLKPKSAHERFQVVV